MSWQLSFGSSRNLYQPGVSHLANGRTKDTLPASQDVEVILATIKHDLNVNGLL